MMIASKLRRISDSKFFFYLSPSPFSPPFYRCLAELPVRTLEKLRLCAKFQQALTSQYLMLQRLLDSEEKVFWVFGRKKKKKKRRRKRG
jgi:hypothetical protein